MIFDPMYFLFIGPPLLLGLFAQWRVKSTFAQMSEMPARMSGGQAARQMLDSAGLYDVGIDPVQGHLSDHYDPRAKMLRLSPEVYQGNSLAALGVACHEAGHAFQDAKGYAPLAIRNMAVPTMTAVGVSSEKILCVDGVARSNSRRSESITSWALLFSRS